jgi:beta-lactamase regulating signal transducer with metallopeptidase domain
MRSGLLLALPLESVVLRLLLALGVALLLLRVVSGWDLRSARARTVLAASPFIVAAAVLVLSVGDLGLPTLLVPAAAGIGALALPIADRYLDFAPMAPVVVGLWAAVSISLLLARVVRASRARGTLMAGATPAAPRTAAMVLRLARELGIAPPRVLVSADTVGGAAVLGVRDPVLLLDRAMLELLDAGELEGVIAHELAHIARRDNLLAWAVAAVRDVAFFVPGAGWAVRALHREREAAADEDAVTVTGRPAALASGLLRVIGLPARPRPVPHGCAALVPTASVVDRVHLLLADEQPTPREHRTELALALAVSLVAVAAALVMPKQLIGEQAQREALGVLFGTASEAPRPDAGMTPAEARVFAVYRGDGAPSSGGSGASEAPPVRAVDLLGPGDRPGAARACAAGAPSCVAGSSRVGLVLRPAPIVLLSETSPMRWQATPVSETVTGERFAMYWLARLDTVAARR